jgi:hypothetical protein
MNSFRFALLLSLSLFIVTVSCKKGDSTIDPPAVTTFTLSYGDSVFYIKNQSSDYIVSPLNARAGTYTAFPEGLEIDKSSGAINVSKSEKGMRYRVTFKSPSGDSSSAFIVISGINFIDKYYRLSEADSVAFPVYNADPSKNLPSASFDEDKVAGNSGCAIKTNNGQINLRESIRNGIFGSTPRNNTRKDFEVKYRLDDKSGKALNSIKILIYYYDTMNDVPQDLVQTVNDHLAMTIQPNNTTIGNSLIKEAAKPRPPCIVIIAH